MPRTETTVIAGAGHAAGQVVASLLQHDYGGRILLIGEESWLPYQRPPLSKKFLAGELPAERLHFKASSFYDDPRIQTALGCRIEALDRERRVVRAHDGREFSWDRLVLATGARARRLAVPGSELAGVHYLRNIDDVLAIQKSLALGQRLAVVGGGYIGLEVAAVGSSLGQQVTVIEAAARVMSRVVSPPVSEFYAALHRRHGVDLRLDSSVVEFTGATRVDGVRLADGQRIAADTVVVGVGIEPNTGLAADAGLAVDDGIVVDERCLTDDAAVYAVGDCTSHPNAIFRRRVRLESVHNALEQAKTAAANICGSDTRYAQVPWFWSDQYDVKLQIAGLSQGYDMQVVRGDPDRGSFSSVYLDDGVVIAVDAI
ncbi:MAG TPA: FAD-dependent oxidoreductase, partial [Woeseiaceae bacterium]|nr:FAD-dependent oxidoreductase [Woeseiaceae bacterium]